MSTEPDPKRPRLEATNPATATDWETIFGGSVTAADGTSSYRKQYREAQPYPHAVIEKLCADPSLMTRVKDEIVTNLESTYKETDLFKLYQTKDLANIDHTSPDVAAKLPGLMKLRNALYSPGFRSFIAEVTGCGELTDRVDMAASAYSQGSHLLCHDDVIGTRAISFIVYFTEEGWSTADGGALELYPLADENKAVQAGQERGVPTATPSKRILPIFNTLAFFGVEPGVSYHSVQEVFTDTSPRLSIQGWYHRSTAPEGAEMASISQLKASDACGGAAYEAVSGLPKNDDPDPDAMHPLSDHETEYLKGWISQTYLDVEAIAKINEKFCEDSTVRLEQFLLPERMAAIQKVCIAADVADGVNTDGECQDSAGTDRAGWGVLGPAHMRRYIVADADVDGLPGDATAQALVGLQKGLFQTSEFASWLWAVTGVRPVGHRAESRRFRSGMDYTVAHHGQLEQDTRLDATICFVDDTSDEAEAVWQSGEMGAFHCYIAAEDEATTAAEVYVNDDAEENNLVSIQPKTNTLGLVLRDPGTMSFVKYVSALGMGSRWDVAATYEIDPDDVGGGDDDDDSEDGSEDSSDDEAQAAA